MEGLGTGGTYSLVLRLSPTDASSRRHCASKVEGTTRRTILTRLEVNRAARKDATWQRTGTGMRGTATNLLNEAEMSDWGVDA